MGTQKVSSNTIIPMLTRLLKKDAKEDEIFVYEYV
jgi:hypothetical protein